MNVRPLHEPPAPLAMKGATDGPAGADPCDLGEGLTHSGDACAGTPCPWHAPSDHHMRDWTRLVRTSGLTERICEHGIGHPDPDSLARAASLGRDFATHGCDGCCWRGGGV